jgi:hypothetical protein
VRVETTGTSFAPDAIPIESENAKYRENQFVIPGPVRSHAKRSESENESKPSNRMDSQKKSEPVAARSLRETPEQGVRSAIRQQESIANPRRDGTFALAEK